MPARLAVLVVLTLLALVPQGSAQSTFTFDDTPDRTWLGRDFWANRLQDWRVVDGRVECLETRKNMPVRTAHVLTRKLGQTEGEAVLSVRLGQIDPDAQLGLHAAAGLLIGAGDDRIDYRLSAQVHHVPAEDGGTLILVEPDGTVTIRDNTQRIDGTPMWAINRPVGPDDLPEIAPSIAAPAASIAREYRLVVRLVRGQTKARVVAQVLDGGGELLQFAMAELDHNQIDGNIALAATGGPEGSPSGFWFDDLSIQGEMVYAYNGRAYGPILHAMYTRGDHGIGMVAQLAPMYLAKHPRDPDRADDPEAAAAALPEAELWVDDAGWKMVASAPVQPHSWTAHFQLGDWDTSRDIPYEVRFAEPTRSGEPIASKYAGVFRAEPGVADDEYVIGSMTCRKVYTGDLAWNANGLWFPSTDINASVKHHDPDLLYFSGDQIYEGDLTPVDARTPEILMLDYLYKYVRWCWDYAELTRDRPTIVIPDDHDVYHGNLWGAGGTHAKARDGMNAQDAGGYKHPPRFVNAVHRTQVGALPASKLDAVVGDGYTTYSTTINDAGVSIAVLSDRMFKASPTVAAPVADYRNGWARAEGFDARAHQTDPAIPLLGEQQEAMLRDWAVDWSGGAWMKVVLSQSPFVGAHTIPSSAESDSVVPRLPRLGDDEYPPDDVPSPDADTHGWPQPARARAVEAMRRGFAFHLNGDQHLSTLLQHGLDDWQDAGYSFSAPAISNTWPRRWFPIEEPASREHPHLDADAPRYTGDYLDGFNNKLTMLAVSNPIVSGAEPAILFDKAPGYSIIRMERESREITFESWPRWVDPSEEGAECFEGWPVTIRQGDNAGSSWEWFVSPKAMVDQPIGMVMTVRRAGEKEPLYAIRLYEGFLPRLPDAGPWDIEVYNPEAPEERFESEGVEAVRG